MKKGLRLFHFFLLLSFFLFSRKGRPDEKGIATSDVIKAPIEPPIIIVGKVDLMKKGLRRVSLA
ncbi:unnamed protein product, partial [marine sediment metagenome]